VKATASAYDEVLSARGYGNVTTEMAPDVVDGELTLPFYFAETNHQQYLYKVPHGYDCHANRGIALPPLQLLRLLRISCRLVDDAGSVAGLVVGV